MRYRLRTLLILLALGPPMLVVLICGLITGYEWTQAAANPIQRTADDMQRGAYGFEKDSKYGY